jgi:hypothetical protein
VLWGHREQFTWEFSAPLSSFAVGENDRPGMAWDDPPLGGIVRSSASHRSRIRSAFYLLCTFFYLKTSQSTYLHSNNYGIPHVFIHITPSDLLWQLLGRFFFASFRVWTRAATSSRTVTICRTTPSPCATTMVCHACIDVFYQDITWRSPVSTKPSTAQRQPTREDCINYYTSEGGNSGSAVDYGAEEVLQKTVYNLGVNRRHDAFNVIAWRQRRPALACALRRCPTRRPRAWPAPATAN